MPLLDVSSVLLDPDFADSFEVIRHAQVITTHGRTQTVDTSFKPVFGVVTANSPSDLDRRDDYEVMTRSITIVCQFFLRGETSDYQPDFVVWRGSRFIVKHVDPYPQFGKGFFQAECSSVEKVDPAIVPTQPGQTSFGTPTNLVFLSVVKP